MLGLGLGLLKKQKGSAIPFKSDAIQWTKGSATSGILIDKIGRSGYLDGRDGIYGWYFDSDGTQKIRMTDYPSTSLTYVDHTTGTTETDTTDANGDWTVPNNGANSVTIDGYTANFEDTNASTKVAFINRTTGDFFYGEIQNATGSDLVQDLTLSSDMDIVGYTEQLPYEVFPIHVKAGTFDFSAKNLTERKWWFEDGTTSTAEKPTRTLATDQTVYLTGKFSESTTCQINDNGTDVRYVGDLSDLPKLTYWLDLTNCSLITGDLSDLQGKLTNFLSLNNCSLITGVYTPSTVPPTITYLDYTGLSTTDMDNTLIAYANATQKDDGTFRANGMTRSSASDSAVALLESRGWTISGMTVV